ncbi:hypothetical protein I8J31_07425 [Marinomonas sp. C1424]|uniref:Transposase n=1 Tax=Marinomonas transparens TaxID=2795388 RepID=A0A934JUG0_9GAMM|nr:hypothetical protein [Marinomonas transparens]
MAKALTPEQQRIQELEARVSRLEREKKHFKRGYRSLDVGQSRSYALIDELREQEATEVLCDLFGVPSSSYYDDLKREQKIDTERLTLRSLVTQYFNDSRGAAGS